MSVIPRGAIFICKYVSSCPVDCGNGALGPLLLCSGDDDVDRGSGLGSDPSSDCNCHGVQVGGGDDCVGSLIVLLICWMFMTVMTMACSGPR
jgi:hypothetical protein